MSTSRRSFNIYQANQTPFTKRTTPSFKTTRLSLTPRFGTTQSPNQSFQSSLLIEETQGHRVEVYGSRLPVLVSEALTHAQRGTEVTTRLSSTGWACLVYGRHLYVWNFQPSAGQRSKKIVGCKELTLPPSDLANKADLVCILANQSSGFPAVLAASPEGILRYWPNIAHEGQSIESAVELHGQECFSLTYLDHALGCLLATTTNTLVLVSPKFSDGQTSLAWHPLKTPQGMLAGLGRRMSSFIFGAIPTQTSEAKQLIKVLKEENPESDACYVYVLARCSLQKWELGDSETAHKLLYEMDMNRIIKDNFLEHLWNGDSALIHQVKCWCIDMQVIKKGLLMLLGANRTSSPVSYALAVLETHTPTAPLGFTHFWLPNLPELQYETSIDGNGAFKLALPFPASPTAYLYNVSSVLAIPISGSSQDEVELTFGPRNTKILGTGIVDNQLLFFTNNSGIVSLTPTQTDLSANWLHSDHSLRQMEDQELSITEESTSPTDLLAALRSALFYFCHKDKTRSQNLIEESLLFSCDLDAAVAALSKEILDDVPGADPRWAESQPSLAGTQQLSVILASQLQDKLATHGLLHQFLEATGLWNKLRTVLIRNREMATKLLLLEHSEKLVAAISLRNLHSKFDSILAPAIKLLIDKRETIPSDSKLTPQDLYYTKVSEIESLYLTLVHDWEEEQIKSGSVPVTEVVSSVNSILLTSLKDALTFRQKHRSLLVEMAGLAEYIPWTSSEEIRAMLLKQHKLTLEHTTNGANSEGEQAPQHLLELADIILDGFQSQISSLHSPGFDGESDRIRALESQLSHCRAQLIQPLYEMKQYERATSLAEKYFDFDFLVKLCEETHNEERLHRYMEEFSNLGFPEHVFKWYLKEGKQGKLLNQPSAYHQQLTSFLKPHASLSWLHSITTGDYPAAHKTLMNLSQEETQYLAKKKTLLSISKLACLASNLPQETKESNLEEINQNLNLILCQETLPEPVMEAYDLDPDTMRVLSPEELIELYVGDANIEANEYDFKKALDIARIMQSPDAAATKVHIWARAILRDRWLDLDTQDPQESLKATIFFNTLELCYLQEGASELWEYLPCIKDLLASPELEELSSDANFVFLIKAAYEYQSQLLMA